MLADRGDDPDEQMEANIGMINAGVKDRPKDMVVTMHLCRGNFRSTFIASGGYEPVADALFNRIDVDGYFMEWDNDRAGGFEPLRFLPEGQDRRARPCDLEDRGDREEGRSQAPHRRGGEISRRSNSCA